MIADSVAFLVREGKRVLFDAEHFFDGFALDPGTRSTACAPPPRPAPSGSCCATPTAARCRRRSGPRCAVVARSAARRGAGHPHPRRRRLRGRQHARRGRSRRDQVQGTINGYRRAHRQREPDHDHRRTSAEDGLRCSRRAPARLTETAHFVDELLNRTPEPGQPYVGKQRLRPQGQVCTRPASRADAATFEHVDPALVGNGRDVLVSELSGSGTIAREGRRGGHRAATSELARSG